MTTELTTTESKDVAIRKTILVAPLNWGLGHATRCMPIINQLLELGVEVILASDGHSLELLRQEYPELLALEMPGYLITYQHASMVRNIAPQITTILSTIGKEKKWLQQVIREYKIDAVISDNRYGLFSPSIPSIFLTHQINIILPEAISRMVNFQNRRYIKRFTECWIPDFEGEPNLSGQLSHPPKKIPQVKFIGPLSRLEPVETEKQYRAAIILSGPEPQRSMLEEILFAQLVDLPGQFILIRGVPELSLLIPPAHVEVRNFATSTELSEIICKSDVVVSRSGYSTVMDLVKLGAQAILIPTPGQTEQEYLGAEFHKANRFYCHPQDGFDLGDALDAVVGFTGFQLEGEDELLKEALIDLINSA